MPPTTTTLIGHPEQVSNAIARQRQLGLVVDARPVANAADGRTIYELTQRQTPAPAARVTTTPGRAAVAAAGTTAVAGVGYAGYLAVMWIAANWALLLGIGVTFAIVLAVLARIGGGCVLNIVCKTHR